MTGAAQIRMLADGRRLHLNDGPIDLIIEVFGEPAIRQVAYEAAAQRFHGLLNELCSELPKLRAAAQPTSSGLIGPVARRMHAAVAPYAADCFITPMAAVAGSVAEEILAAMTAAADLSKAYVNNGGDIALHLGGTERFAVGVVGRPDRPSLLGKLTIYANNGIGGIATSGWRGRSFSLGIADAVTILAATASQADAAATIVANEVDLPGHPSIARMPAREIQLDSDLGDLPVTRDVGFLSASDVDEALARGVAHAERLVDLDLINGAVIHLHGETRAVGLSVDEDGNWQVLRSAAIHKP
jgi:ApbE superfamily uncharacterized protein (UPF0280 family)